MNQLILWRKMIVFIILFLFSPFFSAWSGEYSNTGFYYPLKDDNPDFEQCGRWLERPTSSGGCYPSSGVYHTGSDMMASLGTNVYAISDGVVKIRSTNDWGSGNVALLIEHKTIEDGDFRALYGHIVSNKNVGDEVRAGEKIGEIGSWNGGDHLHFGILSPGLNLPFNASYFGRWFDSEYGVPNGSGYYDNGFVDPIWFISYKTSNNWISKSEIDSADLVSPIIQTNPHFLDLCIRAYPDSRCTGILNYIECAKEKNSNCIPISSDHSSCPECAGGDSSGGGPSNPNINSTDIHITHCKIRPYKEGSWHHEVDVDMAPGQTFEFEIEGRVRNKSNYDLDDVDIDYCFVKDDKDFDVSSQDRMRLDDDQVDIKEGDKESKHTRRSWVTIASDLSEITVETDDRGSFDLPITQENLDDEEITLYFYLDVETEDEEDRDVSDEAKTDEYGKLEIHLNLPQPPPADLNLSVPSDQRYVGDAIKNVFTGKAIEIPVVVQMSGQDTIVSYPDISLVLTGPEFQSPQTLTSMSANYSDLNADGEDVLTVQISSINIPGDYYLKVCIDPQEYITETNENDNCNYVHFVVKKRKSLAPINYLLFQSN